MSAWSTESERVKGMLEVVKEGIDTNEKTNRELSILVDEQKTKKDKSASLIAGIDGHIKTFQELSGKAPELEAAKQTITALEKAISDKWIEVAAEIKALETKSNGLMDKIKTIEAEIKALPAVNEDLDDLIITQQNELNGLDSELTSVNLAASNLDKKIAVLEDKIASAEETKAVVEGLKKEERHIRKELSRWDYIRGAVSKSGLQALEIASAAPLLTGIANDLLTDAFGGSFFLDLVTEDPETGAEILDIYVTREDGKTYSLSEFSGGESIWILQAFKAAQVVVNIEKSGVHFQTAFADEESSALDTEKSEKFIKLYRALLKRAGFEKLLYISHIKEAQSMADHSLEFTKGGIVSESYDVFN
jgi:DNA repair exonuclease SbcCD ATPase subunit